MVMADLVVDGGRTRCCVREKEVVLCWEAVMVRDGEGGGGLGGVR